MKYATEVAGLIREIITRREQLRQDEAVQIRGAGRKSTEKQQMSAESRGRWKEDDWLIQKLKKFGS
jgi:hypothetical protein